MLLFLTPLCTLVANFCVLVVAKSSALLIAKNSALLLTDYIYSFIWAKFFNSALPFFIFCNNCWDRFGGMTGVLLLFGFHCLLHNKFLDNKIIRHYYSSSNVKDRMVTFWPSLILHTSTDPDDSSLVGNDFFLYFQGISMTWRSWLFINAALPMTLYLLKGLIQKAYQPELLHCYSPLLVFRYQ